MVVTPVGVPAGTGMGLNQVDGPMLRWAKGILSMLITERSNLGGATPPDVTGSWNNWETHRWTPPSATPFDAFLATPAAPAASFVPGNNTLIKEALGRHYFATTAVSGAPWANPRSWFAGLRARVPESGAISSEARRHSLQTEIGLHTSGLL
jgi:hypothetical protein